MSKDEITELKQFIVVQFADIRTGIGELREEIHILRQDIHRLDQKIDRRVDELSSAIAETLEIMNSDTDKRFANHEIRLIRLEKRAT